MKYFYNNVYIVEEPMTDQTEYSRKLKYYLYLQQKTMTKRLMK